MDERQIRRELRALKLYALFTTAMLATLTLTAFKRSSTHESFKEIDVERINVVEPDGKYRMVISNRARSIGPIYKGKPFAYKGGTRPGIIFFNDEGTENGGLTFAGKQTPDGKYEAATHLSFDQFNQDQILNFDYRDDNGKRLVGISMLDRADIDIGEIARNQDSLDRIQNPAAKDSFMLKLLAPKHGEPFQAQRVFLGRNPAKSAVLLLSDPGGHPRIRLLVDSLGASSLEFLDARGSVTARLPDAKK